MTMQFRDPVSGLTHLAGAFLGMAGLIYLVAKSAGHGTAMHFVSFSVFAVSVILLYASSALYHLLDVSEKHQEVFRLLDHTMIFVLIAGSYTPFCLLALKGPTGWAILITVWSLAIAGFFVKTFWIDAPRWLSTGLYLLMGWIIVVAIYPLMKALSYEGIIWLVAGGLFYTVGAIIYGVKKPDPFPPVFGFHELWHLFVLAGTTCHFVSVATLLPTA